MSTEPQETDEGEEARFRKEELFVDQSWMEDWGQGQYRLTQEQHDRIKHSPEPIKRLMFAFPPLCMVKATVPLRIPQFGTVGVVVSYLEDNNGTILVKQSPEAEFTGPCRPQDLVVVGYYKGFTPQALALVL